MGKMKDLARLELFKTDKFNTFAYQTSIPKEQLNEMELYRAELVAIVENPIEEQAEVKFSLPPRPSWSDKYL